MHGLAFGEVDADDLPLDLGAHDVGVVGNHRADAAEIDRHVMLGDRLRRRSAPPVEPAPRRASSQRVNMREVQETARRKHGSQQDSGNDDFLFHEWSNSRTKSYFSSRPEYSMSRGGRCSGTGMRLPS